jgi:hypothetical protein
MNAIACFTILAASLGAFEARAETVATQAPTTATHEHAVHATHMMPGRDAPAGVMGSMLHHKGEWMVGVRFGHMSMDGNRDGTDGLTEDDVFAAGYEMAPLAMDSTMAMLDVMYGISDRVTLSASVPYVFNSMDMMMMEGETFPMEANGLGGVQLGALVGLWRGSGKGLHLNAGIALPTGKADATDDMPDCAGCKVDYPTQPGSGTWDLMPGLTFVAETGSWSWGANWLETLRLDQNSENYAFGNRHELSLWGVRRWNDTFSTSLRLAGAAWGDVEGADADLDPMMSPTQDPDLQAGRRIDALLGLGLKPASGALSRHRFAVEIGLPIWQDLDGPQLETDCTASFNWQLWF